ncbi:MAG: metal ABC transporter permease [Verrucomicrobia bacterium]|nr:metal ABC transporter permease [Verrucomicrobiota bacterium]
MKWPLIASLILPWLLVYLGLHIVQRGVIFVDLALAQTAAFGTCISLLAGYDVHDWQSYAFSLGFTFVGAVVLTFTRGRDQRVPQEALIGIVYVVAAAAAILILSKSAGGHEELQRSLVGELLVVPPADVMKTFGLFIVLGAVHFVFRKQFLAISANPEQAEAGGLNVRWWDFVFYMIFGLVVTSFVHIGGVLLVFSYLVVPAVCATYLVNSIPARFAAGWAIATLASVISLFVTARVDLPIGAAIVCVLGLALVLVVIGAKLYRPKATGSVQA